MTTASNSESEKGSAVAFAFWKVIEERAEHLFLAISSINSLLSIPIISLSNTIKLKKNLKKKFKFFKESKRTYWPIPMFFKQNINLFDKLLAKKIIYYEKKFGIYLAYTSVAVCKKLKG